MVGAAVRAVRTVSRAHGPPTTSLGHCITVKDREVEISTQGRRVMKLHTVLWDAGHRLPPQAEPPLCFFFFSFRPPCPSSYKYADGKFGLFRG